MLAAVRPRQPGLLLQRLAGRGLVHPGVRVRLQEQPLPRPVGLAGGVVLHPRALGAAGDPADQHDLCEPLPGRLRQGHDAGPHQPLLRAPAGRRELLDQRPVRVAYLRDRPVSLTRLTAAGIAVAALALLWRSADRTAPSPLGAPAATGATGALPGATPRGFVLSRTAVPALPGDPPFRDQDFPLTTDMADGPLVVLR